MKLLGLCISVLSMMTLAFAETGAPSSGASAQGKEISGVVRIIRANPRTEVFFRDYKDSVFIPYNSKHNEIYAACEASEKKKTAVKLRIHPISREVLGLAEKEGSDKASGSSPSTSSGAEAANSSENSSGEASSSAPRQTESSPESQPKAQ